MARSASFADRHRELRDDVAGSAGFTFFNTRPDEGWIHSPSMKEPVRMETSRLREYAKARYVTTRA